MKEENGKRTGVWFELRKRALCVCAFFIFFVSHCKRVLCVFTYYFYCYRHGSDSV